MGFVHKWTMFVTVVALGVAAISAPSAADEDPISLGIQLRKDGRDQEALPLFQRAVKEQGTPRAFGQLGTCEQALGLWASAESHLMEALAHPRDPWVEKNEASLKTALSYVQDRLGSVEVWGSPAGARVSIDGDALGTLPLAKSARVAVGQRKLTVESPDFQPERRTIDVNAGALVREHVVLQATTVADRPKLEALPADGNGSQPAAPTSSWKTGVGIAFLGLGVGVMTWGAIWVAVDGTSASSTAGTVRDTGTRGWALVAVGAASAAAGGLLLYLDHRSGNQKDIAVGLGPTGALLQAHF